MAASSQKTWEDIRETLLTCKICEEPFDQQERLPRALPCQHTFCGPCLAKLDKGGQLSCPNCRQEIQVAGTFPVELTRSALLDCTEVIETAQEAVCEGCDDGTKASSRCLDCAQTFCEGCCKDHQKFKAFRNHVVVSLAEAARSPSLLLQKVEMCQKHQDKKLEFYCKTCKSATCSSCVIILHKDRDGHDNVELGEVLEQAKGQIESHCESLDNIRESSLQPRAKMAATSLQETDASFKDAEQEIEDVFSKAVNALLDRKAQAVEELRSKWKEERLVMEDQAAVTQSQVSSAKTSTALGRTVSSVGLPSHIVAQEQELERAVQEARAEGQKPLLTSLSYKVTADLSDFMKTLPALGTVVSVRSQSCEQMATKQRQKQMKSVTSQSSGVPTTLSMTSSTILTPEFQLEPGRCRAGCTLEEDGRTLTNMPRPQSGGTGQSGSRPFPFLGTCGSVDLAQPALHYWTVTWWAGLADPGARCEFGLASLQTLDTCGEGQRISDHDVNSATLVVFQDGETARLVGRNWTKDVDTPPPPQGRDVTYTCLWEKERRYYCFNTLGFLYDNRQPQSPRVLVVEAGSCRLLGVRRLSPSPPLRPVLRVWPTCIALGSDASLEVKTGPGILSDVTARQLQSLLERMDR